jgi:hypothetical protein
LRTNMSPFHRGWPFFAESRSSAKVSAGLHRFLVPSLPKTQPPQCPRAFTMALTEGAMEPRPAHTLDGFRLEPPPGGLWRGDVRLALRPRPLAVLRSLVAHTGRLVTKAELRQHVWGLPSMSWSSGMAYGPTRLASCPSRWLSFVCKIPVVLLGVPETHPLGSSLGTAAAQSLHDGRRLHLRPSAHPAVRWAAPSTTRATAPPYCRYRPPQPVGLTPAE